MNYSVMKTKITFCLFLIFVLSASLHGQQDKKKITISGYVTDKSQNPVANAIVMIDGKMTNNVTNEEGFYKIKVKSGSTRIGIFTYTNGFVEDTINGRKSINFTLEGSVPDQKSAESGQADETVNIGYGTIKKKDATTPVSKSSRSKPNYDSYTTIYDLIRAELPGVQVSGTSIKVQGGATSFSLSSEPLLIVDGIPVNSIDHIQPVMVKSVQALKGASASIYGSRGTNGVIVIELIGSDDKR